MEKTTWKTQIGLFVAFAQVKHIKAALVAIIHEVPNENMYFTDDFNVLFWLNLDGSKLSVFLEKTSFGYLWS